MLLFLVTGQKDEGEEGRYLNAGLLEEDLHDHVVVGTGRLVEQRLSKRTTDVVDIEGAFAKEAFEGLRVAEGDSLVKVPVVFFGGRRHSSRKKRERRRWQITDFFLCLRE